MGRLFIIESEETGFSCKHCRTFLARANDVRSQNLRGRFYLIDRVVNVTVGEKEDQTLKSGVHTIVDIYCVVCGLLVGWKYVATPDTQKFKEGKFVIDRIKVADQPGVSDN